MWRRVPVRLAAKPAAAAAAPRAAAKGAAAGSVQGPPKDPNVLFTPAAGVNPAYDVLSAWWTSRRSAASARAAQLPESDKQKASIEAWIRRTDPLREQRARYKKAEKAVVLKTADITNEMFATLGMNKATLQKIKDAIASSPSSFSSIFPHNLSKAQLKVHPLVEFRGKRFMNDAAATIAAADTEMGAPKVSFGALPEFSHYTIALVDVDAPDSQERNFKTRVHWLVSDIPAENGRASAANGKEVVAYEQIHPERGSLSHRVLLLVYGQTAPVADSVSVPRFGANFANVPTLAEENLIGAVMREFEWDESVTDFYASEYDCDEPIFGGAKAPKVKFVKYLDFSPVESDASS